MVVISLDGLIWELYKTININITLVDYYYGVSVSYRFSCFDTNHPGIHHRLKMADRWIIHN
jgi:hypothetical protein